MTLAICSKNSEKLIAKNFSSKSHETKAPSRFTEASLIKENLLGVSIKEIAPIEPKTIYETIDGCHQVYEKLSKGELDNVDYLILNYGYNDLYYQVDITVDGDDVYCVDDTYACCKSFKGSYRYMVNCARKANPNVKIILMNMMFTKYTYDDGGYPAGYHFNKGIKIHDYRKAIFELSEELDAKIVDAYNYMKEQYDYDPERPQSTTWVYKDTVHYTVYGQKKIADYFYKW